MQPKLHPLLSLTLLLILFTGCSDDPLVRHKLKTDFFDGVPDLPPLAQLCKDNMDDMFNTYYQDRLAEASAVSIEEKQVVTAGSRHPPFADKNCKGCHNFTKANMLIAPADQLCEICHIDFVKNKGDFIHGPVAVRDCLACHHPHESKNKALLRESVSGICNKCHQEKRLALEMHNAVKEHNMECVNCHDAHGGSRQYFLK